MLRSRPNAFVTAIPGPPSPEVPVTFAAPDQGLVDGIERITFVRNSSGDVGWMARGLRLTPRTGGR